MSSSAMSCPSQYRMKNAGSSTTLLFAFYILHRSPVFFIMEVALNFLAWQIRLESPLFEDFNDTRRLRIDTSAGGVFLFRYPDHLGIATQENVRPRRFERLAQTFFQLTAHYQILNVNLMVLALGLA